MSKPAFLGLFLIAAWNTGMTFGNESPVDLARTAAAFHFPASELIIEDALTGERKVNGIGVLSAYRIRSKTAFAFYPILITVAKEGTFLTDETKKLLNSVDSIPEGLVAKGGRGPFGTLSLGNDAIGGLMMGDILVPATLPPFDHHEFAAALFSAVRLQSKKIDIRIAVLWAFPHAANLVSVPGGELYYQTFSEPGGDKNYDEPPPQPEFDFRETFTALNELVRKSPLVANARDIGNSAKAANRAETPPRTTTPLISGLQTTPVADTPAPNAERRAPVWPWAAGIVALIVIVGFVLKRRTGLVLFVWVTSIFSSTMPRVLAANEEEFSVNTHDIGKQLGFPPAGLKTEDAVIPELEWDTAGVIRAWRITGTKENSFLPITLAVGRKGTLLTEEIATWTQHYLDGSFDKTNAQGIVRLDLADGAFGYSHLMGIGPTGRFVAAISVTLPKSGLDVRVITEIPREELTPVQGGEEYQRLVNAGKGLAQRLQLVTIGFVANVAKHASELKGEAMSLKDLQSIPPHPKSVSSDAVKGTPSTAVLTEATALGSRTSNPPVESRGRMWLWLLGIAILTAIALFVCKRPA